MSCIKRVSGAQPAVATMGSGCACKRGSVGALVGGSGLVVWRRQEGREAAAQVAVWGDSSAVQLHRARDNGAQEAHGGG
jgi:hypothetical protein